MTNEKKKKKALKIDKVEQNAKTEYFSLGCFKHNRNKRSQQMACKQRKCWKIELN